MMRASLVTLMCAFMVGCGGGEDPTSTPNPTPVPATLTQLHEEVFVASCNFAACHANGGGGLTLGTIEDAYADLVNVESAAKEGAIRVIPGDVDGSYLIQKLRGDADIVDDAMPPPTGLDAERLAWVESWIAAGAQNN